LPPSLVSRRARGPLERRDIARDAAPDHQHRRPREDLLHRVDDRHVGRPRPGRRGSDEPEQRRRRLQERELSESRRQHGGVPGGVRADFKAAIRDLLAPRVGYMFGAGRNLRPKTT